MPKQYKFSLIVFFSLVIGCEAPKETNYSTSVFESSSSVDAVKDQFSKLPDSDISVSYTHLTLPTTPYV